MMDVQSRLHAIAHLLDNPYYSRVESAVWRQLVHHIDRNRFEHTGRLIAAGLSSRALADAVNRAGAACTTEQVEQTLVTLAERGHLAVVLTPNEF